MILSPAMLLYTTTNTETFDNNKQQYIHTTLTRDRRAQGSVVVESTWRVQSRGAVEAEHYLGGSGKLCALCLLV